MKKIIHYSITVSGKVQGVYYRKSAHERAKQLDLKGFVRNETDGTVYMEVEGELGQLQGFIEWCKKGLPRSIVSVVSVKEDSPKNYSAFEILG